MTDRSGASDSTPAPESGAPARAEGPTLAEDLLLLLFQPDSGTIAGEGTLFYALAGAVLADLALGGHVRIRDHTQVAVLANHPPSDGILRTAWDYISEKPRDVSTFLPAVGPTLRAPLLELLIERGDIHRTHRKTLRLFTTTVLKIGSARRRHLMADVRRVLVEDAAPTPTVAALTALLSASGTLPQFDPEIPWSSAVISRAQEFERGNWGAEAVAEAVARTMTAIIVNHVIIAASVAPGR